MWLQGVTEWQAALNKNFKQAGSNMLSDGHWTENKQGHKKEKVMKD